MAAVASEKLLGWSLELGQISYERVLGWQHGLVKMREHGLARDTIITVESTDTTHEVKAAFELVLKTICFK